MSLPDTLSKDCACKGIRVCVKCEHLKANTLKNENESKVSQYLFCEKCLVCHLIKTDSDLESASNCCNNSSYHENISINGISLVQNFINAHEEEYLLHEINKSKWVDSQSGRFKQDYGPKVNFKKKKLKLERFTGLPSYSKIFMERLNSTIKDSPFHPVELCNLKYEFERGLNYHLINYYLNVNFVLLGASIDPHFDDFWLWGDRLITINLFSDTYLTLTPTEKILNCEKMKDCEVLIPLKRFSLINLHGDVCVYNF